MSNERNYLNCRFCGLLFMPVHFLDYRTIGYCTEGCLAHTKRTPESGESIANKNGFRVKSKKTIIEGKMKKNTEKDTTALIENATGSVIPTPAKIDLKSIDDVRLEMAKVYRDMKSQKTPTSDGTRLVYVLAQIGKMIELHDIEVRLNKLEGKL